MSSEQPPQWEAPSYGAPPPPRRSSSVNQVPVVAVLLIIQGALEGLVAILLFVMGPTMLFLSQQPETRSDDRMGMYIASGVYIVLGIVLLIAALLKVIGGIRNLKYRGRTLGIVALASSAVSIFTCYCALTGIGLLIYGLVVYFNNDVRQAFEMGERGASPEEIKAAFR